MLTSRTTPSFGWCTETGSRIWSRYVLCSFLFIVSIFLKVSIFSILEIMFYFFRFGTFILIFPHRINCKWQNDCNKFRFSKQLEHNNLVRKRASIQLVAEALSVMWKNLPSGRKKRNYWASWQEAEEIRHSPGQDCSQACHPHQVTRGLQGWPELRLGLGLLIGVSPTQLTRRYSYRLDKVITQFFLLLLCLCMSFYYLP